MLDKADVENVEGETETLKFIESNVKQSNKLWQHGRGEANPEGSRLGSLAAAVALMMMPRWRAVVPSNSHLKRAPASTECAPCAFQTQETDLSAACGRAGAWHSAPLLL